MLRQIARYLPHQPDETDAKIHLKQLLILYLLSGAIGSIFELADKINDLRSMLSSLSSSSSEDFMEAWLSSNIDILSGTTVANILVVIGFVIYYTGLKSFAEIQKDDFTAENILKIRRAAVCGVIALLLGYIPFIGGFGRWILNLVMYFMLASAYGYLRYSPVFNIRAKAGARLLRSAAIMYIIGMFIPIIGGLFSFMGLLMTIIGWGRIRKGEPIAAVASVATNITYNYYTSSVPIETLSSPNPATPTSGERPKFCSHCGAPCKEYQRYCPNCGFELDKKPEEPVMPIVEKKEPPATKVEPVRTPPEPSTADTTSKEAPSKQEKNQRDKSNKQALVLISGVVIFLIIGLCVYNFWYKPYATDRDAPRYYTFTNLNLRSSENAELKDNIIEMLPYGTELITYGKGYSWARVKANGKEGHVAAHLILSKEDFQLLDGVWGNEEAKKCVGSAHYRLAVIDYLKRNEFFSGAREWQIFSKPYGSAQNTIAYPNLSQEENGDGLIFIVKNNRTNERKLVIYGFTTTEPKSPVFKTDFRLEKDLSIQKAVCRLDRYDNLWVRVTFNDGSYKTFRVYM